MYLPKPIARVAPYLKFACTIITLILLSIAGPIGAPAWVPIAIGVFNALSVLFTPNLRGEYEYPELEAEIEKTPERPKPPEGPTVL